MTPPPLPAKQQTQRKGTFLRAPLWDSLAHILCLATYTLLVLPVARTPGRSHAFRLFELFEGYVHSRDGCGSMAGHAARVSQDQLGGVVWAGENAPGAAALPRRCLMCCNGEDRGGRATKVCMGVWKDGGDWWT